jgi:hypothetical protein
MCSHLSASPRQQPDPEDGLVELAARIEPDGGMPGKNLEARLGATVAAVFAFMSHGSTVSHGPFRSHVQRLLVFLERHRETVGAALDRIRRDEIPSGEWLKLALGNRDSWPQILKALGALAP